MTRLVHRSGREQQSTPLLVTHLSDFFGWAPPSCVTDPEEADVHRPHTGGRSIAVEKVGCRGGGAWFVPQAARPSEGHEAIASTVAESAAVAKKIAPSVTNTPNE
ncbi:hypothetical protein [Amycolatopsis sp. cg13]|uniref:hypothetical protein n=1 Tax=Amycolatopsis sp. cg13 TaxID=3238807 RepID=UPI003523E00D